MVDGSFRVLASGIGFTEGPVVLPNGELMVTSMSRGLLYRIDPAGGVISSVDVGGGPNGLAVRDDGAVVVAQNGGASFRSRSERPVRPGLQVVTGDDVVDEVTSGCLAPNDLVFAPDGSLWFTDPGHPSDPDFAPRVTRRDASTGELSTVVTDVRFPNGLAFGPDGAFYVADSHTHEILRYEVGPHGASDRSVFGAVDGGGPDGIVFDAHGNLYVAAFDTNDVVVLGPDGGVARRLPMGDGSRPTNLCFAGPDLGTLVVTLASGGRVVALDEHFEGALP